jgi:hypothetical protein
MSCKSIFVNLGGGGGGSVNTGVLQIAGGVALDSTLRFVEDQNGTDSILKLSTSKVSIGNNIETSGNTIDFLSTNTGISFYGTGIFFRSSLAQITYDCSSGSSPRIHRFLNGSLFCDPGNGLSITENGQFTIKGAGANIVSFRNSSNVERLSLTNDGNLTISDGFFANYASFASGSNGVKIGSGLRVKNPEDGVMLLQNDNANNFNRLQLGGTTSSFPSIKKSGINLEVKLADDSGYGGIIAGYATNKIIEATEKSGAMGLGFFNVPAINQPTQAIADATYVSGGGGGSSVHTNDTFGNYTIGQVVQALLDLGLLG